MKRFMLHTMAFVLSALVLGIAFWSCKGTKPTVENKTKPFSQVVTPEWAKNAVIYEVNTRQFTPEGTFKAFSAHLPRLKELGVDILWFMPIHPIGVENRKGSLGSYYSVKDYKGVNPEFGTFEDFKQLVEEAHAMGFKVILDWVANHTAHDHPWTVEHPEWYNRDEKGEIVSPFDWTDVADLNYDDNPALWDAMIDALKFWVAEANIDGYRCDVAGMVPIAFWERARTELDAIKPVFMLAEDEGQRDLMVKAFDANYGWEFHHIMNKLAKGEKNAEDVWAYFAKEDTLFAPSSYRMMFTSNHDENSWNGTEFERMGEGARTFAVMTYTIPGFPLIYNGQEVGLDHRLLFFEKDLIDWSKGSEFTQFYTKLNRIKKENEALWNANNGGSFDKVLTGKEKEVLAFVRQKGDNRLLVLLNITPQEQVLSITDQALAGTYTDLLSGEQREIVAGQELVLPAWGYWVMK
ncbi:MAG TPA: alpha-amylase family glycosyl hydrolase [Bacteroidales bacterium]|nr:alpha-amylase family glycosyl hydrolase [Bacteroidales bacterium]